MSLLSERYKLLTSPLRMLPGFIIPGESKCGTTTFFRCLEQHPLIIPPDMKEPNNFIRYGGTSVFCKMHYPFSVMKLRNHRIIAGEASADYLAHEGTAAAIHSLIPEVKIIILLRNPIRRALSDFMMMKDAGREPEEFNDVIRKTVEWLRDDSLARLVSVAASANETPLRYVTKGCYADSLDAWLKTFPRRNMKFIKSERFFLDPQKVLNETFEFLGIGQFQVEHVPHHRKARRNRQLDTETILLLKDFFAPYSKRLKKLLGDDFCWEEDTADLLKSSA